MAEVTMGYFIEPAGQLAAADIRHQVYPQSNLGTIEGSLPNDALGTVTGVCQQYVVSLVGHVAEEVALQHSGGPLQFGSLQLLIAVEYGIKLLLECPPVSFGVYHDVVFCYLAITGETEYLSQCIVCFNVRVHCCLLDIWFFQSQSLLLVDSLQYQTQQQGGNT